MTLTLTAQTLRAFRAHVHWTQMELAEAIPVSIRTLQRYELGESRAPQSEIVVQRLGVIMRQEGFDPRSVRRAG